MISWAAEFQLVSELLVYFASGRLTDGAMLRYCVKDIDLVVVQMSSDPLRHLRSRVGSRAERCWIESPAGGRVQDCNSDFG